MQPLVDNFEEFRKHLDFSKENTFYFCQLIQRGKDSNIVTSSNNRYRRVKSFYISSIAEYDRFIPEIKEFCKNNNARAYIRLSPVSFYEVALNTAIEYMRRIKECQTFKSCNIYDSCCETTRTCGKKVWMIDCDCNPTWDYTEVLKSMGIEVLYRLPTKNGVHYIINPFDRRKWNEELDQTIGEIKSDNPITLLYYHGISGQPEQKPFQSREISTNQL